MLKRIAALCIFSLLFAAGSAGQQISGIIRDGKTNEPIIGATVVIKGTSTGTTSDLDGKFQLKTSQQLPFLLQITFVGYESQEVKITSPDQPITVKLKSKELELKSVEVTGNRISEKQKEAPLTVESIDRIAIKECAQTTFYEALGTLKGVDLTSASLGFTIINTRGFNSTSPVRSLQIIDGVDNQSPGLNFSLGNFLGSSELDVLKVDLIAGASSAYYGPNAFNGVISMTTRSPFIKPGLEVSLKAGERNLLETSVRWAQVFKNKSGEEKFGYKLNIYAMKANDWEANNYSATPQSPSGVSNPGGYDAVNRYGDEYFANGDYSRTPISFPGLGVIYRTGYAEKDLVDYNTHNIKLGSAFHYKIKKDVEAILASSFGTGTTVYQGDNRYSLKDILFFQNRVEIKKDDRFFFRAYATNEDAGKSYDAFFTALKLQQSAKGDDNWQQDYAAYWSNYFPNIINMITNYPGFPQLPSSSDPNYHQLFINFVNSINPWLYEHYPSLVAQNQAAARNYADNLNVRVYEQQRFEPGTARFDSAFHSMTSTLFTDGGSMFYDKSALYHVQGEYRFTPKISDILVGGNYRLYTPDSKGNIFQDTGSIKITNREFGFYTGFEKKILQEKLKLNLTARLDKNENFRYLFSPAISGVYSFNPKQIVRFSFSSAIRNPTLTDQYLFYRVTPLIQLVGNIHGFDSLVTIGSLINAINTQNPDTLVYFNVKPIQPEEVKTIELGYRATLFNHLFMDLVAYYSWYNNFIGYKVGAVPGIDNHNNVIPNHIYRVAANATDQVTTRGVSVGLNYYFRKFFMLNGNYSYNLLDRKGSDDPLIPAYNTPENKYNIGLSARDVDVYLFNKIHLFNFGFSVNYKWIEGFQYEGSPQFTGYVPSYDLVDAQISYHVPKISSTFKLGASNLLNNQKFTVYGGPTVGRLAYFSVLVELNK
jgi:iron complex outermembrane receptor protein